MAEALTISKQQLVDHAGQLGDAIVSAAGGDAYDPNRQAVPAPDYALACYSYSQDERQPCFDITAADRRLIALDGLRVTVGVQSSDRKPVFLPGIVRADAQDGVHFVCLGAEMETVSSENLTDHLTRPLSNMQQSFLEAAWAMHDPQSEAQVAQEMRGGPLALGEISHAILIGTSMPQAGEALRGTAHRADGSASSALQIVSARNLLRVQYGTSGQYDGEPVALRPSQVNRVIVAREHQMPSPLGLDAATIGAALPMAAVRSQGRRPDLDYNSSLMVAEHRGGNGVR